MPPATTRLLHDTEGAAALIPPRATITSLRAAAAACQACDLWRCGTQTVFGEGPARARCVLVGETPGNDEDLVGRPFVGPAGRLLDEALVEAGIDRAAIYVTNAVKHFKWVARGKKRIHHKPSAREIRACRAWVEAELDVIDPELTVIMGATAAQSLLPSGFRVTKDRGRSTPPRSCARRTRTRAGTSAPASSRTSARPPRHSPRRPAPQIPDLPRRSARMLSSFGASDRIPSGRASRAWAWIAAR